MQQGRQPGQTARQSPGRQLALRLGGIVAGLLLAALLAEFALRAWDVGPPPLRTKRALVNSAGLPVDYDCYPSNPNGALKPLPDLSPQEWHLFTYNFPMVEIPLKRIRETPWCVEYRRSKEANRDHDLSIEPPSGVLRIAGIGDSFAFGEGVPLEQSLFKQMEALLGERYEVFNAAQNGVNLRMELDILKRLLRVGYWSRALVVFIVNDIMLTDELRQQQDYINDLIIIRDQHLETHQARAWFTGRSRLLWTIGSYLDLRRIKRNTVDWYFDSYDSAHNAANLFELTRDLRQLAGLPDCRIAFVLYPLMEGLEGDYPLAPIHETVARMAREAGLEVLDLTPAFRGQNTSALQVHSADHHPNGQAHAIAAKAIVEWLRRDVPGFLLPD